MIFARALLLSQAFPGVGREGFPRGGEGGRVLVRKNLLHCAHRPIGGKIWATHGFWAPPTQSAFFRTIGKGGNALKPYFTASAPVRILLRNINIAAQGTYFT